MMDLFAELGRAYAGLPPDPQNWGREMTQKFGFLPEFRDRAGGQLDTADPRLKALSDDIGRIKHLMENIMATLQDVLKAVEAESTKQASLIALVNGLHNQLKQSLGGLTQDQQQALDDIFAKVSSNAAAVQEAIDANTDAVDQPFTAPPSSPPSQSERNRPNSESSKPSDTF